MIGSPPWPLLLLLPAVALASLVIRFPSQGTVLDTERVDMSVFLPRDAHVTVDPAAVRLCLQLDGRVGTPPPPHALCDCSL